jgi:hypothetical protein
VKVGELRKALEGVDAGLDILVRAFDDDTDYVGEPLCAEAEAGFGCKWFFAIDCGVKEGRRGRHCPRSSGARSVEGVSPVQPQPVARVSVIDSTGDNWAESILTGVLQLLEDETPGQVCVATPEGRECRVLVWFKQGGSA